MAEDYVQHTSGGDGHVLGLGCWCQPVLCRSEGLYVLVRTHADRRRLEASRVLNPVRTVVVRRGR